MKVPEEQVAPEGEYDLRIAACDVQRTKADDRDMFAVRVDVEATEDYTPIFVYLVIPNDNDWEDEGGRLANMFVRSLKRFFVGVFGLELEALFPNDEPDGEEAVGATGTALVTQRMYEGNPQNEIRTPRLKE
jgi:hypothetical protein